MQVSGEFVVSANITKGDFLGMPDRGYNIPLSRGRKPIKLA